MTDAIPTTEGVPALIGDDFTAKITDSGDCVYMLQGYRDICITTEEAAKLRDWLNSALPDSPGGARADVAALNRELCEKEGHALGVTCRPCLRCGAQFVPEPPHCPSCNCGEPILGRAPEPSEIRPTLERIERTLRARLGVDVGLYPYMVREMHEWATKALSSAPEPGATLDEGKLWSFLRAALVKGDDISTEHQGGYELYSAKMDAAARDLVPALLKIIGQQSLTKGEKHGA